MIGYFTFRELAVGPIVFQMWGVMAAAGFLAALLISLSRAKVGRIEEKVVWDVMILSLLGMIIGARLLYLISAGSFSEAFSLGGGFSLFGGLAFGGLFVLLYLKRSHRDVWQAFDLLVPGFVAALILVRVGCLVVGDHIGAPTSLPWGFIYEDGISRHPVALYEIIFLFLSFPFLRETGKRVPGGIFLSFCAAYSAFRLAADFLRCSDLSFCEIRVYGLSYSQWAAAALLAAASLLLRARKSGSKSRFPLRA